MKFLNLTLILLTLVFITTGVYIAYKHTSLPQPTLFSFIAQSTPIPIDTLSSFTPKQRRGKHSPITINHTVNLTAEAFVPNTLTIKAGESVTWVNSSGSEATVNSDPHPEHTAYPPLNLGQFNDGDSLTLSFNKPGKYGYHNHFDSTQTGTIIVE